MGTRHHIIVTDPEGVVKVRQYGQWSGEFNWKGKEVLELISVSDFLDTLEAKLGSIQLLQEGDPKLPNVPYGDPELLPPYEKDWFYHWGDRHSLSWKVLKNIVETDDAEILLLADDGPWEDYSYHINYQNRTWTATKHEYPDDWSLVYSLDRLPTIEQFLEATAQWRTEDE